MLEETHASYGECTGLSFLQAGSGEGGGELLSGFFKFARKVSSSGVPGGQISTAMSEFATAWPMLFLAVVPLMGW